MKCVIAGGGTGGHLFPGLAVAEAFVEKELGNEVLFIGTEQGIESRVLPGGKFPLKMIQARPFKGKTFREKVEAIWALPLAMFQALKILRKFQPHIVLGVGGYASAPAVLAAFLLGTKRAIHEQNLVPGMTNQLLRWFSHRIFVSFEETKKYFPERMTRVTGNPVRRAVLTCLSFEKTGWPVLEGKASWNGKGDRFILFVLGGSAGAHRINVAMMEALSHLEKMKSSLRVIHQTGRGDFDFVSNGYEVKGFDALVRPFFDDMASCYGRADLVICRAGASTIAELAACGKAALLIPYPYAAHQHQHLNAQKMVDRGAAMMIRDEGLTGTSLAQMIQQLYSHPEERAAMERAIRDMGHPNAAQEIVEHCYALVEERH
jgi:UDP-N-acetylglucosamine--N-acetylmuramyl-(pentapeptide) pyrophosphoryl-undecaprenol N-acetylglucosamine transferase